MGKKILIFSSAYLPLVGGAEIAVKEITDRISDFSFDMITPKIKWGLANFEKIGNINVYRAGFGCGKLDKLFFPLSGFFKALLLNKKNNYLLIWSIMASYAGFAALFFKTFYKKMPFLLTLQEGDDEKDILRKVGVFYFLWRKIFEKADVIQAISQYLKDFSKRHGAKCEIKVIPNGVDWRNFSRDIENEELNALRNKLRIKNEEFVIITVSRLVKKNAIEDILKAVADPRMQSIDYKLLIIGTGELEKRLKNLVADLGLQDKVNFLGFVDYQDLPKYFKISNVFVRPSLSEGLGNAFLEAMAAGLPVIATPVGGIPDFLRDGQTGLFCKVGDPKSIVEKFIEIYQNQDLKNKLIENGKKLVKEKYDWEKITIVMEDLFNTLIR